MIRLNQRLQAWLLQALLLAAVILAIAALVDNALDNLARQGIASGFGFLDDPAGFGINTTLIAYEETASYGRAFLVGLLNTLLVSALGIVLATVLGFLIGVARLSPNALLRGWAAVYVETIRNIPLLLQIFFWYFAVLRPLPHPREAIAVFDLMFLSNRGLFVPKPVAAEGAAAFGVALLVGVIAALAVGAWARRRRERRGEVRRAWPWILLALLAPPLLAIAFAGAPLHWDLPRFSRFNFRGGLALTPEFVALLLALSLYTASFIAEIVRAGIQAVGQGQHEAAQALGLPPGVRMRKVILPQAMRVIVPPLTNQYLNLTKNSSLAAAIAYPDLVSIFAGTVLNQTGQAVEVIAITMAVYLAISLAIAGLMSAYNRRRRWGEGA